MVVGWRTYKHKSSRSCSRSKSTVAVVAAELVGLVLAVAAVMVVVVAVAGEAVVVAALVCADLP